MRTRFWLLPLVAAWLRLALCAQAEPACPVNVKVVDMFGQPVANAAVTLPCGDGMVAMATDNAGVARLACCAPGGPLTVRADGFLDRTYRLTRDSLGTVVRIGLRLAPVGDPEGRPRPLDGRVLGLRPSSDEVWVRLWQVNTGEVADAVPDRGGRFRLAGGLMGECLLVVLRNGSAVAARPVRLWDGTTRLSIDLDADRLKAP